MLGPLLTNLSFLNLFSKMQTETWSRVEPEGCAGQREGNSPLRVRKREGINTRACPGPSFALCGTFWSTLVCCRWGFNHSSYQTRPSQPLVEQFPSLTVKLIPDPLYLAFPSSHCSKLSILLAVTISQHMWPQL